MSRPSASRLPGYTFEIGRLNLMRISVEMLLRGLRHAIIAQFGRDAWYASTLQGILETITLLEMHERGTCDAQREALRELDNLLAALEQLTDGRAVEQRRHLGIMRSEVEAALHLDRREQMTDAASALSRQLSAIAAALVQDARLQPAVRRRVGLSIAGWEIQQQSRLSDGGTVPAGGPDSGATVIDAASLEVYLIDRFGEAGLGVLTCSSISGGYGKETIVFSVAGSALSGNFVLRRDRNSSVLNLDAHKISQEHPILRALFAAGLPVPNSLWLDTRHELLPGGDFIVMRKAPGTGAGSVFGPSQPASEGLLEDMACALAKLHALTPLVSLGDPVFFHVTLDPDESGDRPPRTYGVRFDPQRYDGVVVMEDLTGSGVRFLQEAPMLSFAEAAAFLEAQARIHARWFDSSDFKLGEIFGPDSALAARTRRLHQEYLNKLTLPQSWHAQIESPRGAILPAVLQDAGRVAAAQRRMNNIHAGLPKTVIHGDEHLGNLYMSARGEPGFIDWCARIEPWVVAFTYFLISTVDVLHRREWEKPLLSKYLGCLARCGVRAPDFEEAWFLYRITTLYPLLAWVSNSSRWQPEAVNTRNAARAAWAAIDHNVLALLGA